MYMPFYTLIAGLLVFTTIYFIMKNVLDNKKIERRWNMMISLVVSLIITIIVLIFSDKLVYIITNIVGLIFIAVIVIFFILIIISMLGYDVDSVIKLIKGDKETN